MTQDHSGTIKSFLQKRIYNRNGAIFQRSYSMIICTYQEVSQSFIGKAVYARAWRTCLSETAPFLKMAGGMTVRSTMVDPCPPGVLPASMIISMWLPI